jgi:hypothetical protein
MAHIHVGQTAVRLEFTIGLDISGASSTTIRYIKPNTVLGEFPATIQDPTNGVVYYDVESTGDLDDTGQWRFWVHINLQDGTELDSDPTFINVYEPGKRYITHPYGMTSVDGGIYMAIEAFRVIYNNNISNLSADDVQAALDEIKNILDTLGASNVSYNNTTSGLSATNTRAAIDELKSLVDDLAAELGTELENIIYVGKNGSDTPPQPGVPLGTLDNPYLTVQEAINSITDASSSKHYIVFVQPGEYSENLEIKPWISVFGRSKEMTKIAGGGTHTGWFTDTARAKIKDIDLGNQDFVFTHPSLSPGNTHISLENVNVNNATFNMIGAGVDTIEIIGNCKMASNVNIHSAAANIDNAAITNSLSIDDVDIEHVGTSGAASEVIMTNGAVDSVVSTGNCTINLRTTKVFDSITSDGSQSLVEYDVIASPVSTNNPNSGVLNLTSSALNVYYDNTSSGLSATDVQNAIDELRTLIP